MPSSPIDVLSCHLEHVAISDPLLALAEVSDAAPDPRSRRYRLGPLLALALLAVLGGATSPAKIPRFIAGYDPELRARVGLPVTVRPAASTLGRLPARLDGDAFDATTWCVRYADDWLLGFAGPEREAEEIKSKIATFLREELKLELSQSKTLITHGLPRSPSNAIAAGSHWSPASAGSLCDEYARPSSLTGARSWPAPSAKS